MDRNSTDSKGLIKLHSPLYLAPRTSPKRRSTDTPPPSPCLHPLSTSTHASRTPTVNPHAVTSWTMCSRGAIQRAAAMRVTRLAHTSSDTKATMSVHQMSLAPPADSPFRSRSYATFVTDQELQQARAEMEEC
jgi:hypothetical protein